MNFSAPQMFTDWSNNFTPETGGIYMLLSNPNGSTYPVLYVGQSNDLRRRINEHLQNSESHFRGEIMNFVYFIENNKLNRDVVESTLVKKYNPKFNKLLKSLQEDAFGNLINSLIKNKEENEKRKQEQMRSILLYLSK